MIDVSAGALAEFIGQRLAEDGTQRTAGGHTASNTRYAFINVKLPNGQEFTIRVEEN